MSGPADRGFSTEKQATRLSETIEAYWRANGHPEIMVAPVEERVGYALNTTWRRYFAIRSNISPHWQPERPWRGRALRRGD